ncbi:S10 family peptidase [Chitinophaga nivalis]|uniref:Carboxypeptidase n=1 Tax=Chitinophaga nivalis TaxID=2991709 RepID=A0ABT3ILM3_9BACT|nr:carboxypeptidase [Chitinophaga nivalis]MCW3465665.1 carboxypeptidase [Chitinophaga nivalis]MCW3484644.1 carboxypeptidase [Chitinophaga nivalis]
MKAFYSRLTFSWLLAGVIGLQQLPVQAQSKSTKPPIAPLPEKTGVLSVTLNPDTTVTSSHEVTVKGQRIPYKAIAGTQPVWDAEGKAIAGLFYTYYERTDVKDRSTRPLVISFNGGPGTPSVWMQIAYTGPRLLNIDDEGYPVQPYGIRENPQSILDIADILYVDPANTGFSRLTGKDVPREKFFGVNADVKYLAEWINTFVTRHNRWASPKYLIGESYGTTRVSGLALELQNAQWMYLNGVILVSPTELGIKRNGPVSAALRLPYFTATAWYHKALPPALQQKDLNDILPEVENFTIQELIPAISMGGFLDEQKRKSIAAKMAYYSGLSEKVIQQHNLTVSTGFFWKELLRDKGYTVGRLDSRYRGIDKEDAGDYPDYNAELTSWLHAFTPAINIYLREELQFRTDLKYLMFGPVHPWNNENDHTGENLRDAMASNPYLHVMIQSGYYDGACDYFNAKYSMWQLDPGGRLKDRLSWRGYRSGHMMYLRKDDLTTGNDDIRAFIRASVPKAGQPAKY